MTSSALEALSGIVGAANSVSPGQLKRYAVDRVVPQAVVLPASVDEMSRAMEAAASEGMAVVPRGGGTAMALGNPPERVDVVMGTGRMDGVIAHEVADLTATVEAGITLQKLDDTLAKAGQSVHLDAPLAERATIGGILAANAVGPRRLGFGGPRDRLIGVRVVDAQGTVFKGGGRVVKNVAGYDLNKLFIGSAGTLGIIVEATFKLSPVPKGRATALGAFDTLEQALAAAEQVRSGYTSPLALDLLNRAGFDFIASRVGLPSMSDRHYILAADIGGGPAAVDREKHEVHRVVVDAGGKSVLVEGASQCQAFWRAVIDMGRRDDAPASMHTRCSVMFSEVGQMVHGHEAMAEGGKLECGIGVHLSHGLIRGAWWGEKKGPADSRMLAETVSTLRTSAGHLGGSFVVESCPPGVKAAIDVWGAAGPELAIMRRLKELFDPGRLFSPGRFVGGI